MVLHPSRDRLRQIRLRAALAVGLWAIASLAYAGSLAIKIGFMPAMIVAAATLIASGGAAAFLIGTAPRVTLVCDGDSFGRTDRLGRRHLYPRSDIARAVRLRIRTSRGTRCAIVLVSRSGRAHVTAFEDAFNPLEIDEYVSALGLTVESETGPALSLSEFARRFPGTLPLWATHPTVAGVLVGVVLVVIVTAIVLATGHGVASSVG